jgi:hypothetical protein
MFVLTLFTLATPLWAQKDAGAIVGIVRDPSGAVVAGAKVTVTDVDRGIQLTFSTNDEGQYVASPLRIGSYSVTVEKEGFKKAVAGPVQVNIQDRVGVDLKLEPGMATEIVTVSTERPQLETDTSELGQVVDSHRINALPLNGRNYAQLAAPALLRPSRDRASRPRTDSVRMAPALCKIIFCSMASTTMRTWATFSTARLMWFSLPWMPSPSSRWKPTLTAPNSAAATAPS